MALFGRTRRNKRRRRPLRRVGLLIVLPLLALLFFAPQLSMMTPLKKVMLQRGTQGLGIDLSVGTLRVGWFTPVTMRAIVATDKEGARLAEAEAIHTGATLLQILTTGTSDVSLGIQHPHLFLRLRSDGSNLEDVLNQWNQLAKGDSTFAGKISVEGGSVSAVDLVSGQEWNASEVEGELSAFPGATPELALDLASKLAVGEQPAGTLRAMVSIGDAERHVTIEADEAPLSVAAGVLRRWMPDTELDGTVAGRLEFQWDQHNTSAKCEGVAFSRLSFSTPGLPDEQLRIPSLQIDGALSRQGSTWQLDRAQIRSSVVGVEASGHGGLSPVGSDGATATVADWLRGSELQATGTLDLAQLSRTIPKTLRLRESTTLTSGTVSFDVSSQTAANGQKWAAHLETSALAAVDGEQQIRWEHPLSVTLAARQQGESWTVDELACRASFLDVRAKGSPGQGTIALRSNLDQLVSEMGRFIDLGEHQISGQIEGSGQWKASRQGEVDVEGDLNANQFVWSVPGQPPWREESLQITFVGKGQSTQTRDLQLSAASVQLQSSGDQCRVQLASPIASLTSADQWPIQLKLQGELETWLSRLRFAIPQSWGSCRGRIDLEADATITTDEVALRTVAATIENLAAAAGGWLIQEPKVQVELAGTLDRASQAGHASHLVIVGSSVALRAEDVRFRREPTLQLTGKVGYRGNLERLSSWLGFQAHRLRGELVGQAEMTVEGDAIEIAGSADAQPIAYMHTPSTTTGARFTPASHTTGWRDMWAEDRLNLTTQLRFDTKLDQVVVHALRVNSDSVQLDCSGTVRDLSGRSDAELNGQITYDWEQLSKRLVPSSPIDFQLVGSGTQPFTFHGPLRWLAAGASASGATNADRWSDVAAAATIDWSSARIEGFQFGQGSIDSELRDGVVSVTPVKLPVNGGHLSLAPKMDLRQEPLAVRLPAGPVVEQVQITPEMCRSWLKYVAPLVADAATVRGSLSLNLDHTTIPLSAPASGHLQGDLTIHAAEVGPGALSRELLMLATLVKDRLEGRPLTDPSRPSSRWLVLPEQRIPFRIQQNRVYHEDIQIVVDDVIIRTTGSVGLDQSLSMVAVIPIRDEWVTGNRWLSALRGQTLRVPVTGSLSSPKVDMNVLDQLTKQFVGGAAARLLEQELGRGLDRLLRPRQDR